MDVDLAGRCRVGVTESCGDGGQRDTGVDHQGGVRVAEAVDGDVRQVVPSYKITEPTAYRIRVDGCSIGLGEKTVTIYPSIAHTQSALSLPTLVLLEQLDSYRGGFDVARGAVI